MAAQATAIDRIQTSLSSPSIARQPMCALNSMTVAAIAYPTTSMTINENWFATRSSENAAEIESA
ncbi:MAG: hypothetical protein AAFQ89_12355, partial [Cyanobacteria bacterium J06626_18]